MSVQVSYSKQFGLGIILLIIIFVIVEIFAYVIMNERDSCGVGLWESGLYDDYSENFVKSLCADYKSIIDFEKPYKHWEPDQKTDTVFQCFARKLQRKSICAPQPHTQQQSEPALCIVALLQHQRHHVQFLLEGVLRL